jgi:hypothetical protein
MPVTFGTIAITDSTGAVTSYTPANVRMEPVTYDRRLYRPPFSDLWSYEGDGSRGVEAFTLRFQVAGATDLASAAQPLSDLLTNLKDAEVIETWFGRFTVAALQRVDITVMADTYEVEAAFASMSGLRAPLLFIAANVVSLNQVDAYYVDLFDAAGYAVTVVEDGILPAGVDLTRFDAVIIGYGTSVDSSWANVSANMLLLDSDDAVTFLLTDGAWSYTDRPPNSWSITSEAEGTDLADGNTGTVDVYANASTSWFVFGESAVIGGDYPSWAVLEGTAIDGTKVMWIAREFVDGTRRVALPTQIGYASHPGDMNEYNATGESMVVASLGWVLGDASTEYLAGTTSVMAGTTDVLAGRTAP